MLVQKNLFTQQRGYSVLFENVRKINYGFKTLVKYLTEKITGTRGTIVVFTGKERSNFQMSTLYSSILRF